MLVKEKNANKNSPVIADIIITFTLLQSRQYKAIPPRGTIIAPRVPDINNPINPIKAILL